MINEYIYSGFVVLGRYNSYQFNNRSHNTSFILCITWIFIDLRSFLDHHINSRDIWLARVHLIMLSVLGDWRKIFDIFGRWPRWLLLIIPWMMSRGTGCVLTWLINGVTNGITAIKFRILVETWWLKLRFSVWILGIPRKRPLRCVLAAISTLCCNMMPAFI